MYIREVKKRNQIVYRLVECYRSPNGPRQQTLLTFNKLDLPKEQWKRLADTIELLLSEQLILPEDSKLYDIAEHLVSLIKSKKILKSENTSIRSMSNSHDYQNIDIESIKHTDVRTIGAEHVAYSAYKELEIDNVLKSHGFNECQRNQVALSIIGRLVFPESECATREWAMGKSGLDMLLNTSFSALSNNSLYRISDKLLSIKDDLEKHLVLKERNIFNLKEKLVLYDLTNTYFEGKCSGISKAKFGRSKEKRKDCRLLTLGFIIDENGFPKTCKVMEGNVSEPLTLLNMIKQLDQVTNSEDKLFKDKIVVIDAGISSEDNLKQLKENGYNYVCVSRNKPISFEEINNFEMKSIYTSNEEEIQATLFTKNEDIYLYCISPMKKKKEQSMLENFTNKYIADLEKQNESLKKKRTIKDYDKIVEKLGRLKEKHKFIAHYFVIDVEKEDNLAKNITWTNTYSEDQDLSYNGSYFLRTNLKTFAEQELWDIYMTLSHIEYSFRCLKTDLAFRPVYHKSELRAESHLFIAVLAYHLLNVIRMKLKNNQICLSWKKTRELLSTHSIVTTEMQTKERRSISITQSSEPNLIQKTIYRALNINFYPIKKRLTKEV